MALEMRTTCEGCGLAACPNCGGELVRRPRRIRDE